MNLNKLARTGGFPVLLALIAALVLAGCSTKSGATLKGYEFTTISRGSIEKTISSTGSLKPVATISVRAQMQSTVEKVYVDYNDTVKRGDVLAELNTDRLQIDYQKQSASVLIARAKYELQQLNYQNQLKLSERNLISEYELKQAKSTLDEASANLSSAQATLRDIETQINQYAYITSPIDGTVLTRSISEGDSVTGGSGSAGTVMFTLAQNLEEMQIEAGVGELDVSSIYKGQPVRFTLEALPGQTYIGTVTNRHLMPTTSNNVNSYTVSINVENQDGSLLPGMTCQVEFIVEQSQGILVVPNAALRYEPSNLTDEAIADMEFTASIRGLSDDEQKAAQEARQQAAQLAAANTGGQSGAGLTSFMGGAAGGGAMRAVAGPGMPAGGMGFGGTGASTARTGNRTGAAPTVTPKTLWYITGEGKLDCIQVLAGISDGSRTEITMVTGDLEGLQVILKEKI
ncbi:MAG: efflux RND transporter periplasmic adaptor subunit [Treponema sp.]|jgi:HlyD family secretion protein|nr:efflux RND transporter periplasmic adaptor subunit [Treponema sp.]